MCLLHCLAGELHLLDEILIDTIVSEAFVILHTSLLETRVPALKLQYLQQCVRILVITIRRQKQRDSRSAK